MSDGKKERRAPTIQDEALNQAFENLRQALDREVAETRFNRIRLKKNSWKDKDVPPPPKFTEEEERLYWEDPGELGVRWGNRARKDLGLAELTESEAQEVRQAWTQMITKERQANRDKQQR